MEPVVTEREDSNSRKQNTHFLNIMFRFWPEILAGICVGFCPFEHLFAHIWELNRNSWKGCKFHPISKLKRVALYTKWTRHERNRTRRRSNGSKQLQLYEVVRHCWSFAWEAYLCGQFSRRCYGFKPLSPAWIYLDSVSYLDSFRTTESCHSSGCLFVMKRLFSTWFVKVSLVSIFHKHLHRLDHKVFESTWIVVIMGTLRMPSLLSCRSGFVWSCKMFRFACFKCVFLPRPIWYFWILVGSTLLPHLLMTRDSCWQREFFVAKVRRPYPWTGTKSPAVRAQCNSARRRP